MPTIDFANIIAAKLNGQEVIRISDTVNTLWEKQAADYNYLSFSDARTGENATPVTLTLSRIGETPTSLNNIALEYSFDKTNWQTWTETNYVRSLDIPAGGTVYLRGDNSVINLGSDDYYYAFASTANVAAGGDLRSIRSKTLNESAMPNYFGRCLFRNMTTLTAAPAIGFTTFGQASLRSMFQGCTALTAASAMVIGATNNMVCYAMYKDCTSMTSAANVSLNATSLHQYAYGDMFSGCSSLVTPPSFTQSAMTLNAQSMSSMFKGTALTAAPAMEIGDFASGTTFNCASMFQGCTSLASASNLVLGATTLTRACYKQMFYGCTALTAAPELSATTLADGNGDNSNGCCAYMFTGCTSLNRIKVAFTDWDSDAASNNLYCYNWVQNVANSGTFECPSALPTTTGNSYIPTGWTVVNTDHDYSEDYFTIQDESGAANTIKLYGNEGSVYASSDNGSTWSEVVASSNGTDISLPANGKVLFKHTDAMNGMRFGATGSHSVNGNIDSLINDDNFTVDSSFMPEAAFTQLFMNDTTLVDAKDLYFGAYDTVTYYALVQTFQGCTNLLHAPNFESFRYADNANLFAYAFQGCTSLTEGADLRNFHATQEWWLNSLCNYMYDGCTSLNKVYAPSLGWWDENLFSNWLYGVANSGVIVADSETASQITLNSASGCPSGWSLMLGGAVPVTNTNGYVSASPINQGDTLQYKVNSGSWQTYSAPIAWGSLNVNDVVTFREIGSLSEYTTENSTTIAVQDCKTPTISNTSGKTVTITADNDTYAAATIYYTTDGSNPTSSSTPYTQPFDVASYNTTVKAISVPSNTTWYAHSDMATKTVTDVTYQYLVFNTAMQDNPSKDLCLHTGITLTNTMKFRIQGQDAGCGVGEVWVGNMLDGDDSYALRMFAINSKIYSDWGGVDYRKEAVYPYDQTSDLDLTFDRTSCYNNIAGSYMWNDGDGNYTGVTPLECLLDVTGIKFSRLQIWDTVGGVETLVFDGKAAYKSGDYGVYDSVSQTFITSGQFTMDGESLETLHITKENDVLYSDRAQVTVYSTDSEAVGVTYYMACSESSTPTVEYTLNHPYVRQKSTTVVDNKYSRAVLQAYNEWSSPLYYRIVAVFERGWTTATVTGTLRR